MKYYLGLDAGGTKTFCLVGDQEANVLGFGKAGTGNYEEHGVAAADKEIRNAVNGALREAGLQLSDITGIGMGIAGADLPEDYEMLNAELFLPLFGDTPTVFRNDSMAGLRGGTKDPFGIVIACGTGCVCAGVNRNGEDTRVGGINEHFGDMVSGSSIGTEGLKAVFRSRDGIYDETLLTPKFVEKAHCKDVDDLFCRMYRGEITYEDLEPMAKLVFEAAREGDTISCNILEWGGSYLAEMVVAVARKLNMCEETFDVVMTGSVFKGVSPVLADAMRTKVHCVCPDARTVHALYEPVVGALLLGMELDTPMNGSLYANLDRQLKQAQDRYGVPFQVE